MLVKTGLYYGVMTVIMVAAHDAMLHFSGAEKSFRRTSRRWLEWARLMRCCERSSTDVGSREEGGKEGSLFVLNRTLVLRESCVRLVSPVRRFASCPHESKNE